MSTQPSIESPDDYEACTRCGANQTTCLNAWQQGQQTCCWGCDHRGTPFTCPECYAGPFEDCGIWDDEGYLTYELHPVRMNILSPPPTAGPTVRTFGDLAEHLAKQRGVAPPETSTSHEDET
jgi:hypothetical protein